MNEAQRLWDECAGILRAQVSEPVWLTSFEAARPVGLDGRRCSRWRCPSFLAKERIEGRYLSLVRDALTEIGAGDVELVLEIAPSEPEPAWTVAPPAPPPRRPPAASGDVPVQDINPRYTFDTFVIGPSNRFAHAAALAVAETPARKYNPLFIYGDAGLGKTHLLQAIGHYVRENYPTYRVRYVTSETFLNEFIDAVRTQTNDAFKRRYRDIDVLLVDDIQFIEGKKETQEEFFHTFNHLHQANRQIVLSLRSAARRHRHPRGPAPQPLQDGPDHRRPAPRPRDPPRHPPQQGRARGHRGSRPRSSSTSPPTSPTTSGCSRAP